ncbi:(+)-neomenthol dehydrogenase [Melia azedarach]|uniref:(+)-neomenthol dehydrogenase n=1 Tax=Melia azedarach TaxID=155640 RepID=A0ACC1YU34_MELAZ|nr:(+)-neomenthol dehydrogenase [Melia azedarach]
MNSPSVSMEEVTKRYAVVTGANKGIGFGICRQLASNGITVVLTARDENRGQEAVEKLKQSGYHNVIFHQLDVADAASIDSLADFIKRKFGKLDILVNNAAISGVIVDADALSRFVEDGEPIKWNEITTETYELVSKCIETNYYGAKRMCEALIPLLQLSNAPRIVNVSSSAGKLRNYATNEWAVGVLSDVENLKEEKVEEVLNKYANDFKEGSPATKGWPASLSAYVTSKAALNAYTRILARKYPNFLINCVCPGYVKTDMTFNNGPLTIEDAAEGPVWLALLPNDGPSGRFFSRKAETSFV